MAISNPIFSEQELKDEVWLPIARMLGSYEVSNLGRIRHTITKRIRKEHYDRGGCACVGLSSKSLFSHNRMVRNHKAVAEAFIGEKPDGYEINHVDGNRRNNRATNLEYVTPAQNRAHAKECGLLPRGESHPRAKLKDTDIPVIKERYLAGLSFRKIAHEYHVSPRTIADIVKRNTYTNVP